MVTKQGPLDEDMERDMDGGGEGGGGRGCGGQGVGRRAAGENTDREPVQGRSRQGGEEAKRQGACHCEHRGMSGKTFRPARGQSAGRARGNA